MLPTLCFVLLPSGGFSWEHSKPVLLYVMLTASVNAFMTVARLRLTIIIAPFLSRKRCVGEYLPMVDFLVFHFLFNFHCLMYGVFSLQTTRQSRCHFSISVSNGLVHAYVFVVSSIQIFLGAGLERKSVIRSVHIIFKIKISCGTSRSAFLLKSK